DEVDVAAAELGIEPADDEAARARELELDRHAGRGHHPWPGHGHADVEAAALVRRGRGRGAHGERRRGDGDQGDEPSHGTLRNQKAESPAPASMSATPPAANRAVISRLCVRCPSRVARFSYTCFRAALVRAR